MEENPSQPTASRPAAQPPGDQSPPDPAPAPTSAPEKTAPERTAPAPEKTAPERTAPEGPEAARSKAAGPGSAKSGRPAPLLRVGSPDSMLAVIPGLLGFHPTRSLVVVGAGPPRGRIHVAFRYDLPDPPDVGAAAKIAAHAAEILARHQLMLAIVVGYGPGPMVTPVADALVSELRRADITLHDMLRVENGRYWSYSCRDPRCCPAEGVPFDATAHPAATTMAAAGNKALRDRAALAATIAPLGGLAEESMRQATRHAERHAADLIGKGAASGRRSGAVQLVVGEGLRAVGEAIGVYRRGGRITGDDRIAWLAVTLADLRVRDDAWARMMPEHVEAHLRLWTDVVRRAPARYVPAPASLLAFTAWQAGNGALANVAAQRALAADPEYSMALLLLDAIGAGVPPSAALLPMTPEEVAASYARTEAREERGGPPRRSSTGRSGSAGGSGGSSASRSGSSGGSRASSGPARDSSRGDHGTPGPSRGSASPRLRSAPSSGRPEDRPARRRPAG